MLSQSGHRRRPGRGRRLQPVTQSATRDFQRCAGIVVDGRIGAQTWSFLSFWANAPDAPFC
ncbi:peptidoglycan-binding domain-containing protein [Streptomyces sp. PvP037]|uniref:peptidoglycan-binding domain-containing protein n=2 Tax=Streptomyces TaxID=1883 RepID=UPI0033945456